MSAPPRACLSAWRPRVGDPAPGLPDKPGERGEELLFHQGHVDTLRVQVPFGNNDDIEGPVDHGLVQPEKFAQHASHAVAPNRPANLAADRKPKTKTSLRFFALQNKQYEMAGEDFASLVIARAEALAVWQAAAFGPV